MASRISKSAALKMLEESSGRFCSVEFIKKDGSRRKISGKVSGVTKLGYVQLNESATKKIKGGIRNVNSQTIKALRVNGKSLVVS